MVSGLGAAAGHTAAVGVRTGLVGFIPDDGSRCRSADPAEGEASDVGFLHAVRAESVVDAGVLWDAADRRSVSVDLRDLAWRGSDNRVGAKIGQNFRRLAGAVLAVDQLCELPERWVFRAEPVRIHGDRLS